MVYHSPSRRPCMWLIFQEGWCDCIAAAFWTTTVSPRRGAAIKMEAPLPGYRRWRLHWSSGVWVGCKLASVSATLLSIHICQYRSMCVVTTYDVYLIPGRRRRLQYSGGILNEVGYKLASVSATLLYLISWQSKIRRHYCIGSLGLQSRLFAILWSWL